MKKLIYNMLGSLLKNYRYRNKPDPFAKFRRLKGPAKLVSGNSRPTVLLIPIRVSPMSNLFEGLVGYALRLRGYDVYTLHCSAEMRLCENHDPNMNKVLTCSLCVFEQNRFAKVFGLKELRYNELVEKKKKDYLLKKSNSYPLDKIFKYKNKHGVSIGKHVKWGIMRHLMRSNIDIHKHEKIIRKLFYSALISYEATLAAISLINPRFSFLSHGIYSTWGACLDACKVKNVRPVVWGRGYCRNGGVMAASNESHLLEMCDDDKEYWCSLDIDEKKKSRLDHYFHNKRIPSSSVDHVNYYKDLFKTKDDFDIYKELNLCKENKIIGVYPNIPWDGTCFSETEDFPDHNAFVHSIYKWALDNPKVYVIIRAHPAEYRLSSIAGFDTVETFADIMSHENENFGGMPKNVRYIAPDSSISSYEVANVTVANLFYSGTMALELAYYKKPAIQVGKNNLTEKGLIFDAKTEADLYMLLDTSVSNGLVVDDETYSKILKYSYYWVFMRHFPEELVELNGLSFESYKFSDPDQILSADNDAFKQFINCVIDGNKFIYKGDG